MHPSAMENGKRFFDAYVRRLGVVTVVDLGSQDVNGSLRKVAPPGAKYVGVDFQEARGVDIVLTDPYHLPFEDESVDVIVCSSCFEHSEMFWLVFLEVLRILKPAGLFYLNVPSNGAFHRYPVDCWRFYPDSGRALVKWAVRSGYNPALLESFTSHQASNILGEFGADMWNDYISVFVKDEARAADHPGRILQSFSDFDNGFVFGSDQILNHRALPEDRRQQNSIWSLLSRVVRLPAYRSVAFTRRALSRTRSWRTGAS